MQSLKAHSSTFKHIEAHSSTFKLILSLVKNSSVPEEKRSKGQPADQLRESKRVRNVPDFKAEIIRVPVGNEASEEGSRLSNYNELIIPHTIFSRE